MGKKSFYSLDLNLSSREKLEESVKDLFYGDTIGEVASYVPDRERAEYLLNSLKHKGNLGNIIEEVLGIAPNSEQRPDFEELGVELKVTPVEHGTRDAWRAGERLVITMISYDPSENEINGRHKLYDETHLAEKLQCILLVVYLRPANHKNVDPRTFRIEKVTLFSPPPEDMPVIRKDWADIMRYVYEGRADELSESLTEYLGACTKGTSGHMKIQGYPPYKPAKPRAFCLKNSYMTYLQNNYIMQDRETYHRVEKLGSDFEHIALTRMNRFIGKFDYQIADDLDYHFSESAKNAHSNLSFAMMGVKSNSCEEFIKANIAMKTLRIQPSGHALTESISLPVSDFLSVFDEDNFDESALCDYFESTRFLLSVWKKEEIEGKIFCRFLGAAFWGMSGKDIYGPLQDCWKRTKDKLIYGVKLIPVEERGKIIICNDLPKMSDAGSIAHVRPHASKSYHVIKGRVYASSGSSRTYAFELPNGDWMTKQSFWLNHDYMLKVVKSLGIKI